MDALKEEASMSSDLNFGIIGDLIVACWVKLHGRDELAAPTVEQAYESLRKMEIGAAECDWTELWDYIYKKYGEKELSYGLVRLSQEKIEQLWPMLEQLLASLPQIAPKLQKEMGV